MKTKIALTLIAIILAVSAFAQGYHQNNGYVDRNGVYHPPHYQTNPNNNQWDNWSTRGNYNPFTGQPGTVTPHHGYVDQFGVYHP